MSIFIPTLIFAINILSSHLDIFSLVFEVYPGVGVAPDEDGEEHGRDDGAGEHDEQSEESLSAGSVQRVIVEPEVSSIESVEVSGGGHWIIGSILPQHYHISDILPFSFHSNPHLSEHSD